MGLSDNDRAEIVKWAARHSEITKVHLYGSRARGDHRPDSDIDLAIGIIAQPGDSDSFTTWMFWKQAYDEGPDLKLSVEAQLEWYEEGAGLERVGTGVERDGVLLYPLGS